MFLLILVRPIKVAQGLLIPSDTLKYRRQHMEDCQLQPHLDADVGLHDSGPEEQHLGPALVQLAHVHRLAEDLTPLVHVLGQQHLVVRVYTGLQGDNVL